jgi:hypothetical protein
MTTLPESARYEVPGTTLPQSPLLVLSDNLTGFDLPLEAVEGYAGEPWGVVRLMVDDAEEAGLSATLMGWGQTPGEALTSAGLRLLWRAEQDGVPLSPIEQAFLLSAAPLSTEGVEVQAVVQAVFDRLDALLRAALELGVDGPQLLSGIVAVLQDADGLPPAADEPADATTDEDEDEDEDEDDDGTIEPTPHDAPADLPLSSLLLATVTEE